MISGSILALKYYGKLLLTVFLTFTFLKLVRWDCHIVLFAKDICSFDPDLDIFLGILPLV
jgi:hypothetical protein